MNWGKLKQVYFWNGGFPNCFYCTRHSTYDISIRILWSSWKLYRGSCAVLSICRYRTYGTRLCLLPVEDIATSLKVFYLQREPRFWLQNGRNIVMECLMRLADPTTVHRHFFIQIHKVTKCSTLATTPLLMELSKSILWTSKHNNFT